MPDVDSTAGSKILKQFTVCFYGCANRINRELSPTKHCGGKRHAQKHAVFADRTRCLYERIAFKVHNSLTNIHPFVCGPEKHGLQHDLRYIGSPIT